MSSAVLTQTNGSTRPSSNLWMRESVQQFFGAFNWEDHPPEVQELKQATAQGGNAPLSLTLTVGQFFSAIDWSGSAIAAPPNPPEEAAKPAADAFTLEDFSDLF